MIRLGIIGGSRFLNDILPCFRRAFLVRELLDSGSHPTRFSIKEVNSILDWADIAFFEWSGQELVQSSHHLPRRAKIITRLHGYELFTYALSINWDHISILIFVSHAYERRFHKMFPQVKLRTEVVHNSIDTDLFSPGNQHNRSFKIGSIGLITPKKRFYELIIAFEQLTRYIPQLKLKIGGPFLEDHYYYNTVLQELPFRLNINDKVSFDGDIPCRSTSLISWYRALDIYITNSYFESFSVAMHEAMACGCLALSHSWDGAEEFIPEDRIYTDDRDLILKILKLYEMDLTKWNLERKNIRKNMVDKFGGNAQTNKLIQLIEETYHI